MQTVIIVLAVAAAAIYLFVRFGRKDKGGSSCGCGCTGCDLKTPGCGPDDCPGGLGDLRAKDETKTPNGES